MNANVFPSLAAIL